VIQRVVTSPTKTEFLSSGPGEPDVWGEKSAAFVFPTHALADAVAVKMRESARAARHETGELGACFVHARTLENDEWDDFARGSLGPASAKAKKAAARNGNSRNGRAPSLPADRTDSRVPEFAVRMDPRRAAEVLRDPAEVD
jgi:hypothetical protein